MASGPVRPIHPICVHCRVLHCLDRCSAKRIPSHYSVHFGLREHYQAALKTKDGAVVRVLVSASPLLDEDGNYAGSLAMVSDVTAVGEAEDILRAQSSQIGAEMDDGRQGENPPTC